MTVLQAMALLVLSFLLSMSLVQASDKLPVFVSVEWLANNAEQVKLVDMSERSSYQKFHLSDAVWLDYAELIKPQDGLQLSGGKTYVSHILSRKGINAEDTIIIYDDVGGLEASRLYWELAMINHKNMAILDGGSVAWVLQGKPVTQTLPNIKKVSYNNTRPVLTNQYLADHADVLEAINNPNQVLVDTRTLAEYVGNPKQKRSGHIPSAILLPWDEVLNIQNGFKQKSDKELKSLFKSLGLEDKNKTYILYCNTAHRAARLWTAMMSQGYKKVKMYDASMQEWAANEFLPLKKGQEP